MLVTERKRMTGFGRTLWRFMQERAEGEINRTELADMITQRGLRIKAAHVSAWMNGDRRPPPGFPYYAALALDLGFEQRCELTWAYLHEYKDHVKGRGNPDGGPDMEGGGVAKVMITCPNTGRSVYTETDMDAQSFRDARIENNILGRCPACGEPHRWGEQDAYLEGEGSR